MEKERCSFCGSRRGRLRPWFKGKEFHVMKEKKYLADAERLLFILKQDCLACRKCDSMLHLLIFLEDFKQSPFYKFFEQK